MDLTVHRTHPYNLFDVIPYKHIYHQTFRLTILNLRVFLLHGYGEDALEMEDTGIPEEMLTSDYVCQPWEFWIIRK